MQRAQRKSRSGWAIVSSVSFVCLCVLGVGVSTQSAAYDVVVRGGTVVDGSGLPRYRADVGITGGFIVRVGDLANERATTAIDATGLFVAPGFINIHSHASPDALPTAANMLTQGVTTEILNPDGGGAADITRQLGESASGGLAVNIGAYIGFNSVWAAVMGPGDRRATPDDVARMRGMIVDGLEHGAWGVSAGLDYKPAYYAQVEEVVRVVEPAGKWRTNFPNHDRLTPESNFSSRAGVAETIAIGEKAHLVPVVTHMKSQGREQGGAGTLLDMMDAATRRGDYTAADAYPYLAGQTSLGALMIPAWAQDGGRDAMLKRFQDPALRPRIVSETEDAMRARFGGVDGVYLPRTKQQLADVVREEQVSPGEAVLRILEQGNETAILKFGSEADLIRILQHPTTSMACDCGATLDTRQHPRAWGSFPRVLGRYVREQNVLTWEDAIRKMTALPASTIGIVDRGYLAPGMAGDVTIFDPNTIVDHATYEDPAQLSEGVRYVLVNGGIALRDGQVVGAHRGQIVSRTAHMPSRPMTASTGRRRLSIHGKLTDDTRIEIDIAQEAGSARAKGSFSLMNLKTREVTEASDLGVLQTAKDWASFTAVVRMRPALEPAAATIIVEHADPFVDRHPRTVTVRVGGLPVISGVLR